MGYIVVIFHLQTFHELPEKSKYSNVSKVVQLRGAIRHLVLHRQGHTSQPLLEAPVEKTHTDLSEGNV